MAVTNDIVQTNPVVNGDEDTWGTKINLFFDQVRSTVGALVTQFNATQIVASAALPKAGGTLTGDVVLSSAAPAGADSVGYRGLPVVSIDADYTFVATDAGKLRRLTGSINRTWTIPPGVLPVGSAVALRNSGTGTLTIARGSGVELRLVGVATNANRSLAGAGGATIVQEDTNVWYVNGGGVS